MSAKSFTNLVVVVRRVFQRARGLIKDNTRQWALYLLRDYPHTAEEPSLIDEEGWVLRTKLKIAFKEIGLVAVVQTEAKEDRI